MWRDLPIDLISRSPIAHWAPVPLRLIVGYGFMEHGFAKLARGLDAFPRILQALGVPEPHLMGWLTILVEILGGLAVLLGPRRRGDRISGGQMTGSGIRQGLVESSPLASLAKPCSMKPYPTIRRSGTGAQ